MRELIFYLLTHDSRWTDVCAADRLFAQSSLGVDATPLPGTEQGPFAFFSVQMNVQPVMKDIDMATGSLQLALHDEPGDYMRIDSGLRAARIILSAGLPSPTVRGTLMAAEWQGDSDDFFDDGLNSIYKSSSWRLVGSGEVFA